MKHYKQFYKDLPETNGFNWAFYDNGFHCFTKRVNTKAGTLWASCYLTEKDITENLEFMLSNGLTRK